MTKYINSVRGASDTAMQDFLKPLVQFEASRQFFSKIATSLATPAINLSQFYLNTIPKVTAKRGFSGLDDDFNSITLMFKHRGRRL